MFIYDICFRVVYTGPKKRNINIFNQNYNKILERDWLSASRFEH